MVPKRAESGYHTLLPYSGRRFGVHIPQPEEEEYEPVDKPVRFYEAGLCFGAQLLMLAAMATHYPAVDLAAATSAILLIALSLWKLVVPPRFSVMRGVNVFMSV
jgi:hypothetical protein